ncbi:hypothetical protein V6N13_054569 [Hibiscus sabdariffa]
MEERSSDYYIRMLTEVGGMDESDVLRLYLTYSSNKFHEQTNLWNNHSQNNHRRLQTKASDTRNKSTNKIKVEAAMSTLVQAYSSKTGTPITKEMGRRGILLVDQLKRVLRMERM